MTVAPSRRTAVVAAVLLLAAAGAAYWLVRGRSATTAPPPRHSPDDPRLSYGGPYRNVRPDVAYVGTAACAECHADKAATYREHPMGRSVTPASALADKQPYDAAHNNPFEAFGARFRVERDAERVRHRRTAFDDAGRPLYDFALEADYAVGSGTRGYSYLTDRDGFLFQTPISWYAQKQRWDVSPGFHPASLSGRPIAEDCLYCHVNRAEPAEGTVNHYPAGHFDGAAIGCERCHGPGALHEQARRRQDPVGDFDDTIVHPGRLAPPLRDAVCEQCHLAGEARVVRRGRSLSDFRPGLPLAAVRVTFVRGPVAGEDDRAVNHVEQMHRSGCFRGGRGDERIGCVSCHDPHQRVGAAERVAHYRRACLNCHEQRGCSLPVARRVEESPQDSCIDCHMPRYPASDIPHTASTDHQIPRRKGKAPAAEPSVAGLELALTPFSRDGADATDLATRDLGLALARLVERGKLPGPRTAPRVVALLEPAVANDPEDWPAREAQARALRALGRDRPALTAYQAVLAGAPRRETALAEGAALAQEVGEGELALDWWRRAVAVNPWMPAYRGGLARSLAKKEAWDELGAVCRDWLRLDPASTEARALGVMALLHTGRKDEARAEFARIEALRPPDLDELRRWFAREAK
jgi:hypothetical protein